MFTFTHFEMVMWTSVLNTLYKRLNKFEMNQMHLKYLKTLLKH
jgi:hypothetical protein